MSRIMPGTICGLVYGALSTVGSSISSLATTLSDSRKDGSGANTCCESWYHTRGITERSVGRGQTPA